MEQQHTTHTHDGPPPSVLRVVEGLHQGARVSLPQSGLAIIGSADDCDLILFDTGIAARHAAITLRNRDVTLRAIDGKLEVDGRSIAPGEVATLATGTPILIGSAKIIISAASGEPGIAGDSHSLPGGLTDTAQLAASAGEAEQMQAHGRADAAAPARASERSETDTAAGDASSQEQVSEQAAAEAAKANARGLRKAMYRYTPWLMTSRGKQISAGALGVFLVGLLFAASMTLPAKITARGGTPEQRAARLLNEMKLEGEVKVSSPEPGVIALTGTAPDQATHAELVRRLDAEGLAPVLRVTIGSLLASAVKDVFRVNGINIDAQYSHGGVVIISGISDTNRRIAPVIEHALRDIQGLSAIRVGEGGRTVISRSSLVSQSGPVSVGAKRVVSVVDGDPAYIVTSDGARYFVGATLPEGHRVLAIDKGSVVLERDGERFVMTF